MKRLMAADLQITETVKDNDRLQARLARLQARLASCGGVAEEGGGADVPALFSRERAVLEGLAHTLGASQGALHGLQMAHQRGLVLERDLQQLLFPGPEASPRHTSFTRSTSAGAANSPPLPPTAKSGTLPPVLKSLPPGYLSNLEGRPRSPVTTVPPAELRRKLSGSFRA